MILSFLIDYFLFLLIPKKGLPKGQCFRIFHFQSPPQRIVVVLKYTHCRIKPVHNDFAEFSHSVGKCSERHSLGAFSEMELIVSFTDGFPFPLFFLTKYVLLESSGFQFIG